MLRCIFANLLTARQPIATNHALAGKRAQHSSSTTRLPQRLRHPPAHRLCKACKTKRCVKKLTQPSRPNAAPWEIGLRGHCSRTLMFRWTLLNAPWASLNPGAARNWPRLPDKHSHTARHGLTPTPAKDYGKHWRPIAAGTDPRPTKKSLPW